MKYGFRRTMAWAHGWAGLVVGWLLFAVFLTGTLSFYRQEITAWMRPEWRPGPAIERSLAADRAEARLKTIGRQANRWLIDLPDGRDRAAHLAVWRDPGQAPRFQREEFDPAADRPVDARRTYGGDFLYYFHFDLQMPSIWGRLLVGLAAVIMLALIVSGIVVHVRIFKDFFTFRPQKGGQRAWLDAHNAVGVMALPFHLMITYTGLVTLMFLYLPWGIDIAYRGDRAAFYAEAALAQSPPAPTGKAVPLVPLGSLVATAEAYWGLPAGRIDVYRPGDAAAVVRIHAADSSGLAHRRHQIAFDGTTGAILAVEDGRPAGIARAVMYGLHLGRFAGPTLRLLYVVAGLAGTAMIATGLVLWLVKRRPRRQRLIEGLNVGAMAGLVIAIAAFFWANRLIPADRAGRDDLEAVVFFATWAVAAVHGVCRPHLRAWTEQLGFAALLYGGLPVLNAATSGRHLGHSVAQGDWMLAGFDLAGLAIGLFLGWLSLRVARCSR